MIIMVVDDEWIVLQGIMELIRRSGHPDNKLIGASDAFEALEKLATVTPDLIITDINMPEMSGLELIAKLRQSGCPSRIAILTGYDEFEYAKQALQLQVFDYLLKPINRDELVGLLIHVEREIGSERKKLAPALRLKLRNRLFYEEEDGHELQLSRKETEICLPHPHVSVLIMEVGRRQAEGIDPGAVAEALERSMGRRYNHGFAFWRQAEGQFVLLFSSPRLLQAGEYEKLQEELMPLLSSESGVMSVSRAACPPSLKLLYNQAQEALLRAKMFGGERLAFYEESLSAELELPGAASLYKELRMHMDARHADAAAACLEQIRGQLLMSHSGQVALLQNVYQGILTTISAYLLDHGLPMEAVVREGRREQRIVHFQDLDEVFRHLSAALRSAIRAMEEAEREQAGSDALAKITDYIGRNYCRDISLDEIAAHVGLHPNYVSAMFRKATGETVLSHLNRRRIEAAIRMMEIDPQRTIGEIGDKIGFAHARHFFKVFKKYTGLTPGQYRDTLRGRS